MTTDDSKHTSRAPDDDRTMADSDMDDQCYELSDSDDCYADPCCEVVCCCC